MAVLVLDEWACETLLAQRRAMGGDRYDEVWEGTYVMNPMASVEHQRLVMGLPSALDIVVRGEGRGVVLPGANVAESAGSGMGGLMPKTTVSFNTASTAAETLVALRW